MIKNKMAKLVGTAMAATLMLSVTTPVVANANEKEEASKAVQSQEYNEQLAIAIEEIRIVADYLDNKDLTNRDNREYALAFATAAVERVRGMENSGHVAFINETAEQLRKAINIADRLNVEMNNIKSAFDEDLSREHKETVLGYLNGSLSEIVHSSLKNDINQASLNAANNFLHEYANKLAGEINGETVKFEESNKENNEQLAIAIEEIRIVADYLDNKDLTNRDNREYALAFASAAVERVRGMENSGHVAFINETAEQLRKAINIADRLNVEMNNIKSAFDEDLSREHKETVLGYLNGSLSEIVHSSLKNDINKASLNAANNFLHEYANKLASEM
ncbi:hypothetical protein [Paraclostridium sordellii]|uniref:hypothetical protein n=1 Tax=Paraclostridium sordellii TaxID=1505 RepID=UPI0005EA1D6D|nr:hypothetical protein [Paeniclostridium sordellii]MBX9181080.1 hypothetical protein [Paeniclostridium sordellii]MDU1455958.1 hypothetical protein [Paeniclostridium sordellii]CEO13713.1 Uncharacterised protein [[Clostridium] sordellii] [Paeniclostridium sordellii]CEP84995.1 Uncharacterised protein [[Clostridium] sordellii] [Paeniclostridium sordellii]CEQ18304.1 Uncharacterised protein [[Clostridium] sordellii] [Paeniclostridium sordellii]